MKMQSSLVIVLAALVGACTAAAGAPGAPDADGMNASGGAPASSGASGGTIAGDMVPAPAAAVFSCDSSLKAAELPFPRLSRVQLEGTLRFAIQLALPAEAQAIWAEVGPNFAQYPLDQRTPAPGDLKGGYSRFDQSIQLSQVRAMYATGTELARQLTASSNRLASLMGTCATDASVANDRSCLEGFLRRWASRVMRLELTDEDVTYYADMAEKTPVSAAAVADVIATVLNAPETLYRVEHGSDDAPSSPLSAFELAARLSYNLWQEPPDDELWAAAVDGSLLEPATYEAELDRLLAAPKLRRSLDEWVSEWLRLGELPSLDTLDANPQFAAFAGSELPTASTRQAMIDDVLESAWSMLRSGQNASALLGDRHSYAKDPVLARIYGTATWDGLEPPALIPSGARSGLLTRAALLASGTAGTRPIHKGYLVRNALLCQQLGAPPLNAKTDVPVAAGDTTTRAAVSARTSPPACAACHALINPAGFVTEGFDALGRERTAEQVFDERGDPLPPLTLDTAAVPAVEPGDMRVMRSAPELSDAIDTSRLFHSCLARHYFRFASARVEDARSDGCLLAQLEGVARSNAPLSAVLKTLAMAPTFKTKRFE